MAHPSFPWHGATSNQIPLFILKDEKNKSHFKESKRKTGQKFFCFFFLYLSMILKHINGQSFLFTKSMFLRSFLFLFYFVLFFAYYDLKYLIISKTIHEYKSFLHDFLLLYVIVCYMWGNWKWVILRPNFSKAKTFIIYYCSI